MTKRALSRIDTSPTTSDVATCPTCGRAVTGRMATIEGSRFATWAVCPACEPSRPNRRGPACPGVKPALLRLGWELNRPKPHVIVVRRTPPPSEVVTGLRAKLAARYRPLWDETA